MFVNQLDNHTDLQASEYYCAINSKHPTLLIRLVYNIPPKTTKEQITIIIRLSYVLLSTIIS